MKKTIASRAALALALAVTLVGAVGAAQQPGKARREEAREAAKDARKDAKEAKEDLKDARKDLREARDAGGDAAAARDDLKKARKDLKESRDERRQAEKGLLKSKWGDDLLAKPAVRAELRLHAERMAKLRRMKEVADEGDKKQLEERVDKLIEKEDARHKARMEDLKAKNGEEK